MATRPMDIWQSNEPRASDSDMSIALCIMFKLWCVLPRHIKSTGLPEIINETCVPTPTHKTPGRTLGCGIHLQGDPTLAAMKHCTPWLSPSISCMFSQQNNVMDVRSVTFWRLHQSPLSEARPPSGHEQMSRMFNASFLPLSEKRKKKPTTDGRDCKFRHFI